jgi:hypothetical protein
VTNEQSRYTVEITRAETGGPNGALGDPFFGFWSDGPAPKYEIARNHEGSGPSASRPARRLGSAATRPGWEDALEAAKRHRKRDPWAEAESRNAREYIELDALRSAAWLDAAARGGDA